MPQKRNTLIWLDLGDCEHFLNQLLQLCVNFNCKIKLIATGVRSAITTFLCIFYTLF